MTVPVDDRDVPVTIEQRPWDDADAVRLRTAQRAELDARYGSDDHEPGAVPTAADVTVFTSSRPRGGPAWPRRSSGNWNGTPATAA